MDYIHNNNNINNSYECILLHGILNASKRVKTTDYCYSQILHGYVNKRRDINEYFKDLILL